MLAITLILACVFDCLVWFGAFEFEGLGVCLLVCCFMCVEVFVVGYCFYVFYLCVSV